MGWHLRLSSDLHILVHMCMHSFTHTCATPPHVQFIKEKNMHIFKIIGKANTVDKEVSVVRQISTIEGKLNGFYRDNKKGAWKLKSFPLKSSGYKNTFERCSFSIQEGLEIQSSHRGCPPKK